MEKKNTNQCSTQTSSSSVVNSYTAANNTVTPVVANTNKAASQKANQTIIGVFDSKNKAESAVANLRQQGFTNEEINIVSKKQQDQGHDETYDDDDITDGALTGGTIGGLGGLLMGAGALMLPGIGPILAVGPITAAVGGAIAGGIAGGLIDWGIPAEASHRYEQEVAHGSILAIIRTDSTKVNSAAQILRQNGAKDVENHSK
jgi:hypothetical protein